MQIKDVVNKIDQSVVLNGWVNIRRDHGKIIFIDLRDRSGIVQVVFSSDSSSSAYEKAKELRAEWVVRVSGTVKKRPEKLVNNNIVTGTVEIEAKELIILNTSKTPPFEISDSDGYDVNEELRMKYRYLDIRRERIMKNIVNRSNVTNDIRNFLISKDFVEVETPILSKSTPEGARDYLVPSRLYNGKFYALPQSPQQYKQLLMAGGVERYFQVARCFRDEDTRGDRQPEFTQIDIEMSFVDEKDILALTQDLFLSVIRNLYPNKKLTLDKNNNIPFITYKEAMEKYNSDKPDVRKNKDDKDELAFLFVVDFPMFEWKKRENRWDAVHHPFTKLKLPDGTYDKNKILDILKKDPSELLAYQYDIVLNGYEAGGGSIRSHDPEMLIKAFETMGNKREDIESKFGHMLEAFLYGAPPHGGIALGLDRIMMILENEPSIREVIAFPKSGDARDVMMDSPSEVDKGQLNDLGIEIKNKDK